MLPWYAQEDTALFEALGTSADGLTATEAARRFKESGPNALPEAKADGLPLIFLRQFASPLIYILIAAGVAVLALGELVDATIIFAVLFFNAIVGTVQEGRAQNTLRALRQYVETNATVLRDGEELVIPDREVVCGDILVLREGEKVSADARLIEARSLKVDEAALTGESEPADKVVEVIATEDLPAPEQHNMVFKSTHVVSGNARAVVVAVGTQTVIGTIAKEIAVIDTEIPLKTNIRDLSYAIIGIAAAIGLIIFILGTIDGQDLVTILATIVSLTVSIIPEGLPIVITLVLASGVWRMSKRNALVKKLQAVEALGQARVIAVDKTGTLTKNEMVVREVWTNFRSFTIAGVGYEPVGTVELDGVAIAAAAHDDLLLLGKLSALAADARVFFSEEDSRWHIAGDPTEAAIRVFGEKIGFKRDDVVRELPPVAELPFDYRHKYHAAAFGGPANELLVISGAPEVVLSHATRFFRDGENHPLRNTDRDEIEAKIADMSSRGLRVVALASREHLTESLNPEAIHGLTFVGLIAMQDILRPEVAGAMARAQAAGIRVVMITGDHKLTAQAIAKEAGIWKEGHEVLTGADIDEMLDPELSVRVGKVSVFARVTPEHKLRIVQAYKHRGEIIAMTGDGVNDAPSLVAADLGVAMGGIGTEVAKEAADIVLLDDNFGTIVSAVEEGRSIYKTIKKVILYLFSTSLGEVLTIVGALVLGFPLPLLAAQIIWLNFVTDGFLDVALAMEPKERGLLSGSFGRPKKYLIDAPMVRRMVLMALPMMIGTLALFHHYAAIDMKKAWTISLTVLAAFQWINAWNCRSEGESFFRKDFFSNKFLVAATVTIVLLQLLALYTPFLQHILHTVPLNLSEWGLVLAVASSILFVEEIRKFFYRLREARVRALLLVAQ